MREIETICKLLAYSMAVYIFKRVKMLSTAMGYDDDKTVSPYMKNYGMLWVVYIHHRYVLEPLRWTDANAKRHDLSSSHERFELDLRDNRPFVFYTVMVAALYIVTITLIKNIVNRIRRKRTTAELPLTTTTKQQKQYFKPITYNKNVNMRTPRL